MRETASFFIQGVSLDVRQPSDLSYCDLPGSLDQCVLIQYTAVSIVFSSAFRGSAGNIFYLVCRQTSLLMDTLFMAHRSTVIPRLTSDPANEFFG
jgi:hypothetical protein